MCKSSAQKDLEKNIQIQENLFSDVHCNQFLWNAQIQPRDDLTSPFDEVLISTIFLNINQSYKLDSLTKKISVEKRTNFLDRSISIRDDLTSPIDEVLISCQVVLKVGLFGNNFLVEKRTSFFIPVKYLSQIGWYRLHRVHSAASKDLS